MCQLTCQPAHRRAEGPLISAEFTSGQPPPTEQIALSVATEGFFCVLLWRRRGLSESASSTHSVSNEILQSASLDKLSYQVEPLVFVKHSDEPQNMRMVETSHDFDLQSW